MPILIRRWNLKKWGVGINGQRTWKVLGPDLGGQYGSLQGVGGLEATVRESDGLTIPVINDYLGNVLATISGISTTWNPVRVDGYGPALGYQASPLTAGILQVRVRICGSEAAK
jgi:hypothetical protein